MEALINEQIKNNKEYLQNWLWLNRMLSEGNWTHALTLNFTTGGGRVNDELSFGKGMTLDEYRYKEHERMVRSGSRWIYCDDGIGRAQQQEQAESILYNGLLRIKQKLYGKRCYKKDNMNRLVVYEYGDKEHRLHAHCLIDFSDYQRSAEDLESGIKAGISCCGGLATNEYELQELYSLKETGYGWHNYITKKVDYKTLGSIDWRNSTIKRD